MCPYATNICSPDVSVTMGAYSCNVTTATDQQLLCETEPMADIDLLNTTKGTFNIMIVF